VSRFPHKALRTVDGVLELDLEDLTSDIQLTIKGTLLDELAKKPKREPTAHDEDGNLIKGLAALSLPVEVNESSIRQIVQNRETAKAERMADMLATRVYRNVLDRGRKSDEFAIDNISAFIHLRWGTHGPEIIRHTDVDKFQRYEEVKVDGQVSVKELAQAYRTNMRRSLRRLAYLAEYQNEVEQLLQEVPPIAM
jgi:hypothetical protein